MYIIVGDHTVGYCEKCKTPLQEDKYLNKDLNLQPDEPVKRKYTKKNKRKKNIKKKKKKSQIKKKIKKKTKKKKK